jgi:hypothetical protein
MVITVISVVTEKCGEIKGKIRAAAGLTADRKPALWSGFDQFAAFISA